MTELEELYLQRQTLQNRISDIEGVRRREENESYVGRYFRYKNSYSCPESEDEKWWIYSHVIGITQGGNLRVVRFEDDKSGRIEIGIGIGTTTTSLQEEITEEVYEAAREALLTRLTECL
jgi:ribosomal protein L35AE/L33A